MNNLTLYKNNPFDLLDQFLYGDDSFYPDFRAPAIDVREEDGNYIIEAELPGLSEKDVKLELKGGMLTLATAARESKDEQGLKGRWLRRERKEFRFSREFSLPEDVDADKIEAKFRDGLLTIALPKKPESAPRIVPVKVA